MKYTKKVKIKNTKKFKKKYFLWLYLALFLSIQVFSTIQTATAGAKLASLEEKARQLSDEKRILEDSLVSKSSLKGLEEKAEELGLKSYDNIVYFQQDEPFAKAN